jgi:hypothetical protein
MYRRGKMGSEVDGPRSGAKDLCMEATEASTASLSVLEISAYRLFLSSCTHSCTIIGVLLTVTAKIAVCSDAKGRNESIAEG